MVTAKPVKVPPESELGRKLKAAKASGEPVLVDTGERIYTLVVSETPDDLRSDPVFANYDPERALEALRAVRGMLKGVDTEQLLADLAEQREQDSLGRPAR